MTFLKQITQNSLIKRIFSAIFFGVGGAAGSRVLMLLANILLSHILGQTEFGKFSSISSTVNLFVTFSGVGISATLTRYVAANRDDRQAAGMYIRTLSSICKVMSILLTIVLFVFSRQISQLSTGTDTLTVYFRLVALSVLFASMSAVEQSILVGYECFAQSSLIQLARCALFCVGGFLFSRLWGIYGAVSALLLSHVIQFVFYRVANSFNYRKRGVVLSWQWNQDTRDATFSYAIPAFLSGLFVMPVHWIGNAMLTRSAGFDEMAVFTVANQWMAYITYIPAQMGQMRPIYTDLFVRKEYGALKKTVLRITLITTLVATAVALVGTLFSTSILRIYGPGYPSGRSTFVLMLLAAVLYTAQVQTGFVIQATKKMWLGALSNGIWGCLLIASYAMLLSYGAAGYAMAYCIAYFITFFIQLLIIKKQLNSI